MFFTLRIVTLLLLALVPAAGWGGTLDDYYLSRLAPAESGTAHRLSGIASGPPAAIDRSQTMLRHSAWLDWEKLQPATQKTLAKVLARPSLAGERVCTPVGGHFSIHYATSGADAPDLTDANGNNVPDWVETVAGVFEYVYSVEVTRMGYRRPPPDSALYDVYLKNLAPDAVYGYTTNDSTGVTSISYPSYIEIDKSFTNSIYSRYSPMTSLRITAAHEFHHAIQYGYNAYFTSSFAEMTASWMEDEVYDSGNQLYDYLADYLPATRTSAIDSPELGNTEYGRWIFIRYLAEVQGSRTAIRSVWEKLATMSPPNTNAPDLSNEIPIGPVIDSVLQGNLANNFFGFAKRILVKDWSSHRGDIALLQPDVTPVLTLDQHGTVAAPAFNLPTPYTFAYYKYLAPDGAPLAITFSNLSPSLAVAAFMADAASPTGWREYSYDAGLGRITIPAFTGEVYLLVCNNGGDFRAPGTVSFPADVAGTLDGVDHDANVLSVPPQDPLPVASTGSSKSGCFIATAAYGSYLHPKVAELRHFRDRYLMTNLPGRLFVSLYYTLSPPIAEVIAGHEWMRAGVRVLLVPVVFAVEHPAGAAVFVMVLVGGAVYRRSPRRERGQVFSKTIAR